MVCGCFSVTTGGCGTEAVFTKGKIWKNFANPDLRSPHTTHHTPHTTDRKRALPFLGAATVPGDWWPNRRVSRPEEDGP